VIATPGSSLRSQLDLKLAAEMPQHVYPGAGFSRVREPPAQCRFRPESGQKELSETVPVVGRDPQAELHPVSGQESERNADADVNERFEWLLKRIHNLKGRRR